MKFLIVNRYTMEHKFSQANEPLGIISIRDPSELPIDHSMAHAYGEVCEILNVPSFHDVDSLEIAKKYKLTAFTPDMAKEILTWTTHIINAGIELIIVQCYAGISRSAGVAAALSLIINGDDKWVFEDKRYLPNRLVYKTILETHFGSSFEETVEVSNWRVCEKEDIF